VFDPELKVAYTGMLPGYVAGHYALDELYIDLQALTEAAGGTLHSTKVEAFTAATQTFTAGNEKHSYDIASFDIGIHSALPKRHAHVQGVKPLTEFAVTWQNFVTKCSHSSNLKQIVVIGGGAAGVEVALAMAYRLQQVTGFWHQITIVEQGELLQAVSKHARQILLKALHAYKITLRPHSKVQHTTHKAVILESGDELPSDLTLITTGPKPYDWLTHTDVSLTNGFISVKETLQTVTHQNLFAVGDCAHFVPQPLPKAGVYAVREVPILNFNIRSLLTTTKPIAYNPQPDYLKLISLGEKRALADKWGVVFRGKLLWQLKNAIDKRFVKRLSNRH
jgi:selenide,water dikinase